MRLPERWVAKQSNQRISSGNFSILRDKSQRIAYFREEWVASDGALGMRQALFGLVQRKCMKEGTFVLYGARGGHRSGIGYLAVEASSQQRAWIANGDPVELRLLGTLLAYETGWRLLERKQT